MTELNNGQISFLEGRVLAWFSLGIPSAVAAKMGAEKYGFPNKVARMKYEVVHCDTSADEHPDNARWFKEISEWIGWPVKQLRSTKYSTVDEVNEKTRYMSGPDGARCTAELKKAPRIAYQWAEDVHIWGMAKDEGKRIRDFEWNNPELRCEWILRDAGLTTKDCHELITKAGIRPPKMYELGYKHNNCLGCLKSASPKYWNMIRKDFPEVFAMRAKRSRELGVRLVKVKKVRVFLDELALDNQEEVKEDLSCGPACNFKEVEL